MMEKAHTIMTLEDSPVDHGYFSLPFNDTGSSVNVNRSAHHGEERSRDNFIEVTPTGRPLANRSQSSRIRVNDSSIITMLQEQQALLQEVLSTQKTMTEKQLEMDKELCMLKQKIENEESTVTSSGCSSSGASGKRKRTVSRTLSVSMLLLLLCLK